MTLKQIREATEFEALKPAIKHLSDNMEKMTYGDFMAYRNTLEWQAKQLGRTYNDLNALAEQYQQTGEI